MEFTISMDDENVKELLGDRTTSQEFQEFCKDAITSALLVEQLRPDVKKEQL